MAIEGGTVPAFRLTPIRRNEFRITASNNASAATLPGSIDEAEHILQSAYYLEETAWIRADHAQPLRKLGYIIAV